MSRKTLSEQIVDDIVDKQAREIQALQWVSACADWLARHPEFTDCPENIKIINDYFAANSLPQTYENLDAALEAKRSELVLNGNPVIAPVREELPAWGSPKSKKEIDAIPRKQFREFFKTLEFRELVDQILRSGK